MVRHLVHQMVPQLVLLWLHTHDQNGENRNQQHTRTQACIRMPSYQDPLQGHSIGHSLCRIHVAHHHTHDVWERVLEHQMVLHSEHAMVHQRELEMVHQMVLHLEHAMVHQMALPLAIQKVPVRVHPWGHSWAHQMEHS